jgi:hypothetical protein
LPQLRRKLGVGLVEQPGKPAYGVSRYSDSAEVEQEHTSTIPTCDGCLVAVQAVSRLSWRAV